MISTNIISRTAKLDQGLVWPYLLLQKEIHNKAKANVARAEAVIAARRYAQQFTTSKDGSVCTKLILVYNCNDY